MDLELPGMSGGEAIEQIMSVQPVPILVLAGGVRSGVGARRSPRSAPARSRCSPRTTLDLRDPGGDDARRVPHAREAARARVRVLRHPRGGLNGGRRRRRTAPPARGASVIGICASAGGPQALAAVLAGIPAGFPIPILVVQHIAKGFIERLRASGSTTRCRCPCGWPGPARPRPGVWIAPEGAHLLLTAGGRLVLDDQRRRRPAPALGRRAAAQRRGRAPARAASRSS